MRWGEQRTDGSNVRITSRAVESGLAACKETWGMAAKNMFVKGVGPNKKVFQYNHTNRMNLINGPDGWESMEGVPGVI